MNLLISVWNFWKETWLTNRLLFLCEAGGSIAGASAATVMAVTTPDPNLWAVFSLYLISTVLLFYAAYWRRSSWVMILMAYYFVVTAIGLIKLIGV